MQKILRYAFLIAVIGYFAYGEYLMFGKKAEWTAPHSGTVIYSHESHGRYSSECMATVKFDNGDTQEVNTGNYLYSVNERFTYQLDWHFLLGGVCGVAYSWSPGDWIMWFQLPVSLLHLFVVGFLIATFLYYIIVDKNSTRGNNLFKIAYEDLTT